MRKARPFLPAPPRTRKAPICGRGAALILAITASAVFAQAQNQIVNVGFTAPFGYVSLPRVAPGGVLTLFTTGIEAPDTVAAQTPLPNSLWGVAVRARVMGATDTRGYPESLPILPL